jgi:type I restriction enzyme S subunit
MSIVKLRDIANVTAGQSAPQGNCFSNKGTPFIRAGSLELLLSGKREDELELVSDEVAKKNRLKLQPAGTIVFAKSGMSCMKGYVYVLKCPCYVANHLACVSPINVNSNYLAYYFMWHKPNQLVKDEAYPSISLNDISNISIEIHSDEKQNEIVAVLDKVNKLISLRKQQLEALDVIVKSRFVEMFGDPVYNTKNFPTKKLAELGSLDRGRSKHRPRNAPELLNGPYPLIQTGDVASADLYITKYHNTYSELGLKQSKMWKAGTLCITIAANIAQTAILTFDACFPDSVVGFIPNNDVSSIYIHYWFGFFQKLLEEQAPQVAQKNINLKILSELNVIVPDQDRQQKFTAFVEQVDKSKFEIQKSLEKLETLKKSLMQKYFG